MSITSKPARTRKRNVDTGEPSVTDTAKLMAATLFKANKEMNAAKARHDKIRKELYALMKQHGIENFETVAELGVPIVAEITTPLGEKVDPAKLQKLVSMDQFLEMVSVTQKAVTETVGSAILNQVTVPSKGTENVVVHAKKG